MEHQALPTLQEVAATLQKLGVEHERQLSELRRQVELLETQVRSEVPALPESQAPSAPAPDGHPESLPLGQGVQHPQETGERSEGSLRAMFTYPELPGMLSSGTLKKRAEDDTSSSSSSSSLVSNPAGGKHITVTTTWASKQYRAPGLDSGDDKLPNLKDVKNPVAKRADSAHFKLHPFFNEAQRAGLRREDSVRLEHVTNLAMAGLSVRDREDGENQHLDKESNKLSRLMTSDQLEADQPKKPPWFVSLPGNRRNVFWDVVGAIFVLYDCFMIPLRVFNPPVTTMVVTTEWMGLLYWTFNIPVTLTLGYVVDGQAIMDPYRIFIHYLKTWFIVDATVLPFDWTFAIMDLVAEESSGDGEVVKLLRAFRLVRTARLIRLLKLKWILEAIDDIFESEMAGIWMKIVKMVLLLLAINHIIACVWYLLAIGHEDIQRTWLSQEDLDRAEWDYKYACAFHWSITQFTPASMEIAPQNMSERTFTIAVVVFALVGFSYVVGSITGSLGQLRSMSEHTVKEFWKLRMFLKRHRVPPPLALRIKRFVEFEFQRQQKMMPLETVGVLKLLSEQMMSELQAAINIPHMSVHPLFQQLRDKSSLVMHRICNTALGHKQLAPGDLLFMPGEQASCMYFLTTGRLWYRRSLPDENDEVEGKGEWVEADEDWITEPGIWLAEWEHLGSATATRPSSVIKLRSEHLYEVVRQCPPALCKFLKEYATRFLRWLDETEFEDLSDIFQGDLNSDLIMGFIPNSDNTDNMAGVSEESLKAAGENNFLGNQFRRMSRVFGSKGEEEG
ncbi:unnamed protein product [Cladocopium goreaui]|uniref:Potassium voltage-gated channel protein eag n=1 Tax=Cladocopium goreaui TaxID=2562237 RepID=A0A9P1FFB0_9DINO|nr:unnamed protein product [Cladocopium goreaui]